MSLLRHSSLVNTAVNEIIESSNIYEEENACSFFKNVFYFFLFLKKNLEYKLGCVEVHLSCAVPEEDKIPWNWSFG